MSLTSKLLSASGGGITYVDEVFSAYTYVGNGSSQTINNGIDLAGKSGLVWIKNRDAGTGHILVDTVRGGGNYIFTNQTLAQAYSATLIPSFNSDGFATGGGQDSSGSKYVSWTFRKAPKFFDVVTYTGTGVNRTVPHSLNSEVGTLIVKRTDVAADWQVYHRSAANTEYLVLNSTAAKATGTTRWNSTTPSTTAFSLGTDVTVNANGGTYVAYLYAHDTTAYSIVKCGSFTTDGSGNATVDLGWEPQFLIIKTSTTADTGWLIEDSIRGLPIGDGDKYLEANSSAAEASTNNIELTATGFKHTNIFASRTFIYIAIRRSNKPPTLGTQVYNAIARTGTGAAATVTGVGFAPDFVFSHTRNSANNGAGANDRLRGSLQFLSTNTTSAESTISGTITSFDMDGFSLGTSTSGPFNITSDQNIFHFFKRAVGVFSEICYTGSGSNKTEIHNLGKSPDLMIVKSRSSANEWNVWCTSLSGTEKLILNSTAAKVTDATAWNSTQPTSSVISLGTAAGTNTNAATYVAYLFATNAGISKVFSYTGNGTSQTIDCGFTTGARFIMVKRTDSTGDWYVWDSVRGIVASNDPHISLNTTAAEVTTDDSVDPNVLGFDISQNTATNINVTSGTYIGLAFA
jgi:hypothetical protein